MGRTSIEWATHSLNPGIYGCKEYSPGCANCYAAAMAHRFPALRGGHDDVTVKRASGVHWTGVVHTLPIGDAIARVRNFKLGRNEGRPRVFVTSMADVLHDAVEIGWMASIVRAMALRAEADWLLLTKRAERLPDLAAAVVEQLGSWPANVWVGVSVESQPYAEERIPYLLRVPARVRWLSCEPLLGRLDVERWLGNCNCMVPYEEGAGQHSPSCNCFRPAVSWVVAGGESGPKARPVHPEWARSLRDQCVVAGVPFLWKQNGEWAPSDDIDAHGLAGTGYCEEDPRDGGVRRHSWPDAPVRETARRLGKGEYAHEIGGDTTVYRVGKHAAGRLLDGFEWSEVPNAC